MAPNQYLQCEYCRGGDICPQHNKILLFLFTSIWKKKNSNHDNINTKPEVLGVGVIQVGKLT